MRHSHGVTQRGRWRTSPTLSSGWLAATAPYPGPTTVKKKSGSSGVNSRRRAFQNKPSEYIADGDKVAVLAVGSAGGEEAPAVDILTYDGAGQLTRFEAFGGNDVLERAFPK